MERFRHQVESLQFQREQPRVLDASDPGTGKTRVVIEAFAERRERGGGAMLCFAPRTSLRSTWQVEFHKFARHLVVSIATADDREEAFARPADAYITNHDAAKWVAKQPAKFFERFDTLIVDESGAYKHHTSGRSKALARIKKYFPFRILLNGTPNPNSITELWHQLALLDDGQRLGSSFFAFRQSVCTPQQVGPAANMVRWSDRPGAAEAVAKRIEDITIRHVFEDCIDIPENHRFSVPYFLSPEQLRIYEEMRLHQVAELKAGRITALNAATVVTKLLQIASGAVYDESGKWIVIDRDRYELVLDIAEQRAHAIVFFLWNHQKECLIDEARKRGITFGVLDGTIHSDRKRAETVEYFQKGLYRLIFAHPKSAAHSLTLTRGTATIWASPTYDLEWSLQGDRRIYRAGQTAPTESITVVAAGTIEQHVQAALDAKAVRLDELLQLIAA